MKRILFLALFSLSSFATTPISEGECIARPSSKKYVDFDSSTSYPKKYQFTCDFDCKANDEVSKVTAFHEVIVSSLTAEARDVVCFGVKIKKVMWGYDFDRVDKFFSYEPGLVEISQWGRREGILLDHENSKYLMDKLIKDLNLVASSYRSASRSEAPSANEFKIAVDLLDSLLQEIPEDTSGLDELISKIELAELQFHTGENLVLRVLSSSAKWRVQFFNNKVSR